MCYSISLISSFKEVQKFFALEENNYIDYAEFYRREAFGSKPVYIIPQFDNLNLHSAAWGFIADFGLNNPNEFLKKYNTYNARSERLFESRVYQQSIKSKRCLIIADGFFEPHHSNGKTQAYYCFLNNKKPKLFAFAGLYNELQDVTLSVSLITTQANDLFGYIHNKKKRMPLVLDKRWHSDWLSDVNPNQVKELLKIGFTTEAFAAYPITEDFYKNRALDSKEVLEPKGEIITEPPEEEKSILELPFPSE